KFEKVPDFGSDGAMATILAFGPFRLDAEAEILFRGSDPLPVGKRAVVRMPLFAAALGAAWSLAGRSDKALTLVMDAVEEFQRHQEAGFHPAVRRNDLSLVRANRRARQPCPRGAGACAAPWGPRKRGTCTLPQR